jgi:hypothetical protein
MPVIAGARAALPLRLSKYLSKAAKKRIPLHRKHGDKNYYKGTGSAKTGHLNSKGRFQVDPSLLPDIVVPDLSEFKVSKALSAPFYISCGPQCV